MAETRKVGERGQVTIPKRIREEQDIQGGDELKFTEEGEKVVIEKEDNLDQRLEEAYKDMGEEQVEIAEGMLNASEDVVERID